MRQSGGAACSCFAAFDRGAGTRPGGRDARRRTGRGPAPGAGTKPDCQMQIAYRRNIPLSEAERKEKGPTTGQEREGGGEGQDLAVEGGQGEQVVERSRRWRHRTGRSSCGGAGTRCAPTPEGLADVVREGADIRALGAFDDEADVGRGEIQQLKPIDMDELGGALDGFALARELVERHALDLDGGHHGGHLHLVARGAPSSVRRPVRR